MFSSIRKSQILAAAMLAAVAASTPAAAEQLVSKGPGPLDPLMAYAEQLAPRGTFYLDNSQDVELVRFKSVHDIELCAARPNPDEIGAARRGYAIAVQWDQETGVILPGNCLTFEAQRVKISPPANLPQNVVLTGTVRILR